MKVYRMVFLIGAASLGGCVTANVDEMTFDAPVAGMVDEVFHQIELIVRPRR